jgi:shikimate kinase/3-dehydroquinate synthase
LGPPALDGHIALVGFMGAGKTTVGAEVARRLGLPFLDADAELERVTGSTIPELFAEKGEAGFRELEEQLLLNELLHHPRMVLALGGGAVESEPTRRALRDGAFTVLLHVEPEEAWARVEGGDRPLARDRAQFEALYERRAPLYAEVADAVADDADGVVLEAAGVLVEPGALSRLAQLVPGDGAVALVTEPVVNGIHGADAQLALGARLAGVHEVPTGERAKHLDALGVLWEQLRIGRRDAVVALGGGCVTDAAGLAAAMYLRGVAWVPVPTTLVGQVDAAIGGKTAIDLPQGKNLVGAFHWPARTLIDPELLATLPERQVREGLAEVVKTGLLAGEPLWELETEAQVRACAAYKSAICLRDPQEGGVRAFLNLGHTFGHALEAAADYEGVTHGQAVALGLLAAARVSGNAEAERIVLDVLAPEPVRVDPDRAWAALARDKKGGQFVLLPRNGAPEVGELPADDVRRALGALIRS